MKSANNIFSPAGFILAAKKAHPAFKYAVIIAGLAAIVAVTLTYGISPATLIFGVLTIFVFMVLFFVFSKVLDLNRQKTTLPAVLLLWSFLAISLSAAIFLYTSAFFDFPLPIKSYLIRQLNSSNSIPSSSLSLKDLQSEFDELILKESQSPYQSPELNRAIDNSRRYLLLYYFHLGEAAKARKNNDPNQAREASIIASQSLPSFDANKHLIPSIQHTINFLDKLDRILEDMEKSPDFPSSKADRLINHRRSYQTIRKVYFTLINAIQNPESNWEEKRDTLQSLEQYNPGRELASLKDFCNYVQESD